MLDHQLQAEQMPASDALPGQRPWPALADQCHACSLLPEISFNLSLSAHSARTAGITCRWASTHSGADRQPA